MDSGRLFWDRRTASGGLPDLVVPATPYDERE
jgi:hypothetical protein